MGKPRWNGWWLLAAKSTPASEQKPSDFGDHTAKEKQAEELMNQGKLEEAEAIYRELIDRGVNNHIVYGKLTAICGMQGRLDELTELVKKTLELNPNYPEAYNYLGNALKQQGELAAAIEAYNTAVKLKPNYAKAHYNLGLALMEQRELNAAINSFKTAIQLRPNAPEAHYNLGLALMEQRELNAAIDSFKTAIQLKPNAPEAHYNLGLALMEQRELNAAIDSFKTAIQLNPNAPEAHYHLGAALQEHRELAAAINAYKTTIQLNPNFSEAHNNLAVALMEQHELSAAIDSFNTTIQLKPDAPEVHNNLGLALMEQGDLEAAIVCFKKAIQLNPSFPDFHNNLGNTLAQHLNDPTDAIASLKTALQLDPDYPFVAGLLTHLLCYNCQWSELPPLVSQITHAVYADKPITPPFALLALVDDPRLHRQAAATWVRELKKPSSSLGPVVAKPRGEKIHIAYLSADFHDHATSYLMAELFELHDRNRFELTAISFGPSDEGTMRQRMAMAFDHFEEVSNNSDIDVARLCRQMGVDLAVDLKGFTQNYRVGILAQRCAPIQINWLGYPGTMATPFIDYIVADRSIISEEDIAYYSEKVIWLPDSYQVNDGKRGISDKSFTRAECDLPDAGFVFCCFNNNYKILPHTFDVWMRILKRVPDSVLWLLEGNPTAAANLRREALCRGIASERLVFAKRMPLAEHLARQRLADLFIDTWPCNAHTTASDALWSGLPVLTLAGRSFASRVAASLLQAIGLPELITRSDKHYEDLAVALAQDPARLQALQQKLTANRLTQPLFNCERFTRNIESAFEQVMERHWAGAEPDHLAIVPAVAATQLNNLPVE